MTPSFNVWTWRFSCRKNTAILFGPRIADKNFTDTRIFLIIGAGKKVGHSEAPKSGRKKANKHKLFALVNVQMALGQTAGCPRVNRAQKFMCSHQNTGNINFSLEISLTGGLSQGCPDFQKVYVFKVYVPFFSCPTKRSRFPGWPLRGASNPRAPTLGPKISFSRRSSGHKLPRMSLKMK